MERSARDNTRHVERIVGGDKINKTLVRTCVKEAIANQRAGKKIAPARKTLNAPAELAAILSKDKKLSAAFSALTPGRQREYGEHIPSVNHEKTRIPRMEKATPVILLGAGLHDKYKNC